MVIHALAMGIFGVSANRGITTKAIPSRGMAFVGRVFSFHDRMGRVDRVSYLPP